jgi:hypothetical protein
MGDTDHDGAGALAYIGAEPVRAVDRDVLAVDLH